MKLLQTDMHKIDPECVQEANHCLTAGKIIIYPTDTVYGLGANIFHREAVLRIRELKGREQDKPFSCMISDHAQVQQLCTEIRDYALHLAAAFWPGPVTFVFRAKEEVPEVVVSAEGKIGLRVPAHAFIDRLMAIHGDPVVSTSANLSGEPPPTSIGMIRDEMLASVDLVVDAGPCPLQIPSTVVDVSGEQPALLRWGAVPFRRIRHIFERYIHEHR